MSGHDPYVSGRRMGGTVGSMALGNWDAGEGNCVTQRWVRARLLLHVPPRDGAATLMTIAARADMEPHAVSDHLRCMSEVSTLERANRKTRYYRRTEEAMPKTHDPRPLQERIAEVLPDPPGGLTARAIGLMVSCRTNTVSSALKDMIAAGAVERSGAGKRGDPYRYNVRAGDNLTLPALPTDQSLPIEQRGILPISSEDWNPAETEATPRPVPPDLSEADTLAPPEKHWFTDADLPDAYALVAADLHIRANEAADEADIMRAASTLLQRIPADEADR